MPPLLADLWHPDSFEMSLLAAAALGLLGIALLAIGFKVFEWITPKLNVEEELTKYLGLEEGIIDRTPE